MKNSTVLKLVSSITLVGLPLSVLVNNDALMVASAIIAGSYAAAAEIAATHESTQDA